MSAFYPSAIIVANNDLTENVKSMLVKQLAIDEVLDGYTFDTFVDGYSSYLEDVKKENKRILIIRSYQEDFNRNLTDVNIFIKLGLAHVLHNKIGPHGITYKIVNLTWDKLCIYGENRSIL